MTSRLDPNSFLRRLAAYAPGDQPSDPLAIKLNTNEFPYPAAPEVIEAIKREASDSIRLYPSSRCDALRARLGELNGVTPESILIGNGSDEILRLLIQAYSGPGRVTGTLDPTYSLYPTLVQMTDCEIQTFPLIEMERIPESLLQSRCDLFLLCVPNPPLGTLFEPAEIERIADRSGLLILDEAYIDFAPAVSNMDIYGPRDNVVITRTFSKSYGLAGMRVGYAIARPEVIAALDKLADSYNVNRISQAAALGALEAREYYKDRVAAICRYRDGLREALIGRGFSVPPSHGNFVFARHERALEVYEGLKARHVYVRYFAKGALAGGVRISIGSEPQIEALLSALDSIL